MSIQATPAAVSTTHGRVDVFARADDGSLEHWWGDPSDRWLVEHLGGGLAGAPAAIGGAALVEVFAILDDGTLACWWWDGHRWSDENLGGAVTGTPAATSALTFGALFARGVTVREVETITGDPARAGLPDAYRETAERTIFVDVVPLRP